MGAIPFNWQEVQAFVNNSDYHLNGWECEQIINMSRLYCSMLTKGREVSCPAPYSEDIRNDADKMQAMRDRVAAQWDSFGQGLKSKK